MAIHPTDQEIEALRTEVTPRSYNDGMNSQLHVALFSRWLQETYDYVSRTIVEFFWDYDQLTQLTVDDMLRLWDNYLINLDFGNKPQIQHDMARPSLREPNRGSDVEQYAQEDIGPLFVTAANELRPQLDLIFMQQYMADLTEEVAAVSRQGEFTPQNEAIGVAMRDEDLPAEQAAEIVRINQAALKNLSEKDTLRYELCGSRLFIGHDHDAALMDWYQQHYPARSFGTIQVRRSRLRAGSVVVTGANSADHATITAAIHQFSDKAVKFE